jgi:hypothetical protein
MPRRRAVRVIGASLAAMAVPGVSPRLARAAAAASSAGCSPGQRRCQQLEDDRKTFHDYCCPVPEQQWECGDEDNGFKCRNTCPPVNPVLKQKQQPTWSSATYPGGRPKKYNCCILPDTIPRDGECDVNCKRLYGPTWKQCDGYCCPPSQRCQGKKCVAKCSSASAECGEDECCLANEECCLSTTCCPPHRTCCGRGPGTGKCCDQDEYCLYRLRPGWQPSNAIGKPQNLTCVSTCNPVNRCGDNCCGRGFICKKGRCRLNV